MKNDQYPSGTIAVLLNSGLVKQNTARVLKDRLERETTLIPVFFDKINFETLQSVCKRLIPQSDRSLGIDLAGLLDEKLASGIGKGWRYYQMPPDKSAFSRGLHGISETAELMFNKAFAHLEAAAQDDVLNEVQSGRSKAPTWEHMPAPFFFEELLASLTELYYSHPLAKEEIGEVAFADGEGWQKIGLNELEAHEPLPLKDPGNGA